MSRAADLDAGAASARIRGGVRDTIERVRSTGQTRWVGWVVEAPVEDGLRCYAHAGTRDRFYWEELAEGNLHCAWGSVDEIESAGRDRFRAVRDWAGSVRSRLDWLGDPRSSTAPTFFGGFGFEEDAPCSAAWKAFPSARFVLPEVLLERDARGTRWVSFARIEPGSSAELVEATLLERFRDAKRAACAESTLTSIPSAAAAAAEPDRPIGAPSQWDPGPEYRVRSDRGHATFEGQVAQALEEIDSGRLEKVVLARSLRVDHDGDLDVPAFLGRLRGIYPTCALIAVGRGQDTFLAATPETLIRVSGREVETAALAGSAPRGREPEEDRAFAAELLSDTKERREHAHVVDAIRRVLEPRCERLEIPAAPRLRALFGIQHLETAVHGWLLDSASGEAPVDVLALVEALHPTPAVGGVPGVAAGAWLRRFEGLERGWYAAPVGWLDLEGGGNFRVALRSALIRNGLREGSSSDGAGEGVAGSQALLFAGAGIVAGSDPGRELAETRVKLRALLAPLTEI